MDIVLVVAAYLIGSLSFGRIAGVLKGFNLAERDTPGASGTFRQLGPKWGVAVALADIAKGVLVAYLSGFSGATWAVPVMGMALVAGHNWPLFFGFRGGGGIAPTVGYFAFLYPAVVGLALLVAAVVIGLYWQLVWKANRRLWYPIPVGAMAGYAFTLAALWPSGVGFWAFVLVSVVVALRGVGMARRRS
ncbi:MAG: glycerol-3-phosphate acyltransferase [Meiothermus sp.]|nr:glycerol-3-phosphate acyltransferase [Meiothermus sp.]